MKFLDIIVRIMLALVQEDETDQQGYAQIVMESLATLRTPQHPPTGCKYPSVVNRALVN